MVNFIKGDIIMLSIKFVYVIRKLGRIRVYLVYNFYVIIFCLFLYVCFYLYFYVIYFI